MARTRWIAWGVGTALVVSSMVAALGSSGCAQHVGDHAATVAPPAISDAAVVGLSDQLTDIYRARDWSRLKKLLAVDYVGTVPGVQLNAVALEGEFAKITLIDLHREAYWVKPLAPGLVLLNEDVKLTERYDGQDISGPYRMTTIWTQREGQWRLLFEQEILVAAGH